MPCRLWMGECGKVYRWAARYQCVGRDLHETSCRFDVAHRTHVSKPLKLPDYCREYLPMGCVCVCSGMHVCACVQTLRVDVCVGVGSTRVVCLNTCRGSRFKAILSDGSINWKCANLKICLGMVKSKFLQGCWQAAMSFLHYSVIEHIG